MAMLWENKKKKKTEKGTLPHHTFWINILVREMNSPLRVLGAYTAFADAPTTR